MYLCKDYPRIGDTWKFKSDEHTSDAARSFAQNLRCVGVENRGKLVDEAADLLKKNKEVWVVEATYELNPGISTPEITALDLEAHLSQDEIASLPWYLSKRQPEVRSSYVEMTQDAAKAGYWETEVASLSATSKDIYTRWQEAGYPLTPDHAIKNTLDENIKISMTSFLPSISLSFDDANVIRWSDFVTDKSSTAATNAYAFQGCFPGTLMLRPWQSEVRYFFKTWTEAEWPAYANATTVTPYWHYSLDFTYKQDSFMQIMRNESLKAYHMNRFTLLKEKSPMMNVTTTLASISGDWSVDLSSAVAEISGIANGAHLFSQAEYSYLDTLFNKSTSNIEYGQSQTVGTCEGSFVTEPLPLDLNGEVSYDKDFVLDYPIGWLLFSTLTPMNFSSIINAFGLTYALPKIFTF